MGAVDELFGAIIAIIIVIIFFFTVLPALVTVTGVIPSFTFYILGVLLIGVIIMSIIKSFS
jgi:hypothetical protein